MSDVIFQTPITYGYDKLAIFDFDWTMVRPVKGVIKPRGIKDWKYLRPSVPDTIRKLSKVHHIVIFTDQSKPWKVKQIMDVVNDLDIQEFTIIAGFAIQKPDTSLFMSVFETLDPSTAFYVGDSAGRITDWSDKDRVFAERLGIPFFIPEDVFPL